MIQDYYKLERLPFLELPDLAKFVVTENFKHHLNGAYPLTYETEIDSMLQDEINHFENSKIYVAKDSNGHLIGSIRVLKWNGFDLLPVQKLFSLNVDSPNNLVWHIGRFAISQSVKDIHLLKKLMACAIHPVCQNPNATAYAECDKKLFRVLLALGIRAQVMGKPMNYLGSETIPIKMSFSGLIDFYTKHKHLIPNLLFTHQIEKSKNYTFG